ncbi:MAG TPA: anaerobic glycerol-3-phosphate dehydrogenase subunit C, partial [Pirellulaceae bacterium]|nr:anaerobic glycerol-3-phosphate dehydrogenase subunit C [Pirellulaceae bacterium]
GTLALITEATLATSPLPQRRGVVLLFFSRLDTAARAAADVVKAGADACDLMDRRLLSIARELDPEYERIIPPVAEAMLLVEFQADTSAELNLKLKDLATRVRKRYRETFEAPIALETEQRNRFWRLARRVIPTLYRLKGARRAVPFVEDIAVPPEQLPQFLVTAQNIFKQHQVTASIFSHAGHGQLHLRPFVDLADPATPELLVRLAEALYHETLAIGGTISGEHGLGWSRSWFARRQLGNAWQAMQAVKQLFDPKRRLNPDKVFTDETQPPRRQLRQVRAKIAYRAATETDDESVLDDFESASRSVDDPSSVSNLIVPEREPATAVGETPTLPILDLNLVWKPDELTTAARTCNGCGRCRTTGSEERMCPIFRGDPREESTPRAKANLMRAIATGQLEPDKLATGEFKRLVDLCVNCHQCRIDCPANVDIPKLMIEAKSQYVGRNGMTPSDWAMARIDLAMALASRFAPQANWLVRRPFVRWGLEKFFGIAAARPLPRFQKRSFLREAARRGLTSPPRRGGRRVAYFVDSLANWCDLELAWSVVQVLERQGIAVYVPPKQRPSGMSLISSGALERARRYAEANVELLAECVRQGYDIVCSEPAATLALKHEYPQLLDDSDARLVASRTEDIQAYLVGLKREDRMELDLKPLNYTLAYHLPCHQRALYGESPSLELLSMIRGLQVRPVEKGCSGMAGTWGMKRENYRRSLRIGQPLAVELRRADYSATVSECSACRMQIEHLSRKTTIHPIKLLAMSYGLLPDDKRLTRYASETTV